MTCRICLEPDNLISVCGCSGTMGFVHQQCIDKWRAITKSKDCELCKQPYRIPFTLSCSAIIYLLIGLVLTCIHASITNYSTKKYPGDVNNSTCGTLLMFAMYSAIFCILRCFEYIYTKTAYILWPLGFFGTSIVLQLEDVGFDRVELWSTYILVAIFFISWATIQSFLK